MADPTDTGLPSTAELTARLFMRLHEDGSLSRLSDDLRRKLVHYLSRARPKADADTAKVKDGRRHQLESESVSISAKHPLEATNWLIANHLHRNSYSSTLSVFRVECGRPDIMNVFSITDILTFLGFDLLTTKTTRLVSDYVDCTSDLFLWKLLLSLNTDVDDGDTDDNDGRRGGRRLVRRRPTELLFTEKAVQTEDNHEVSTGVESRLRELDAIYSRKKAVIRPLPYTRTNVMGALERLVAVNAVAGLGDEVRMLRENEAKQMKDREREKLRKEMEEFRRVLEDNYRDRFDKLVERERDSANAIEKQKNSIGEELYRQRQQIIADLSSVKQRREEWEADTAVRQMELNRESFRLDQFRNELEKREETFRVRESKYEDWLRVQRQQIAVEERQNHVAAQREIEVKQKETFELQTRLSQFEMELQLKRRNYEDAIMESEKWRSELDSSRRQIESLKNEVDDLKALHSEEVASLRTKFENGECRARTTDARHNELVLEMMDRVDRAHKSDRDDLISLTLQVKRLTEERDRILETCSARQHQLQRAKDKLREQEDEIETLRSHIKELEAISTRFLRPSVANRSLGETIDFGPVDVHETYFDTSLSVSHLPPELELGSTSRGRSKVEARQMNFSELALNRIRLLELEGQALAEQYLTFKVDRSTTKRFDGEEIELDAPKISTPNHHRFTELDRGRRSFRKQLSLDLIQPVPESKEQSDISIINGAARPLAEADSDGDVRKDNSDRGAGRPSLAEITPAKAAEKPVKHESTSSSESDGPKEVNAGIDLLPSVSSAGPDPSAGLIAKNQSMPMAELCSTIDLDSAWKRANDSSDDASSASKRTISGQFAHDQAAQQLLPPLHSTPQSTARKISGDAAASPLSGSIALKDAPAKFLYLSSDEARINVRDDDEANEDGISDGRVSAEPISQNSDFDW